MLNFNYFLTSVDSYPQNRCKFRKIYEYSAIFVIKLT